MAEASDVPSRRTVMVWSCPVCGDPLGLADGGRRWACERAHSFDVAREGYVNLLLSAKRKSRQPGDSAEMVAARRRFLATGAYDPVSRAVAAAVAGRAPRVVLDVGCGEGRHTRFLEAPVVAGIDLSKPAVAAAARAHPEGWYAVASAAALPVPDGSVDLLVVVFGPVMADELARALRPGGVVVAAHPGPHHLAQLRALVYDEARPHEVKPPLRHDTAHFETVDEAAVTYSLPLASPSDLHDLFAMTPYRWHGPVDLPDRLSAVARDGLEVSVDVRVTVSRRRETARSGSGGSGDDG